MRLLIVSVLVVAGCAGTAPLDDSFSAAHLEFASPPKEQLRLRAFASIDSHQLGRQISSTLAIRPGKRTVGYFCEIYTDGPPPPTVTMVFAPGRFYVFNCTDDSQAIVEEKSDNQRPAAV